MNLIRKKNLVFLFWKFISKKNKLKLFILLLISTLGAFAEILSLGAVIPFITLILSPDSLSNSFFINYLVKNNLFQFTDNILLFFTIIFIFFSIIAGLLRIFLLGFSATLSFSIGLDLDLNVYRFFLNQKYESFITKNSSDFINVITKKNSILNSNIIYALINLISSSIIVAVILFTLFFINFLGTISLFLFISFFYTSISRIYKSKIFNNGLIISKYSDLLQRNMHESFGSFREILINKMQEFFCLNFLKIDKTMKDAEASNLFIGQSPKLIIEMIAISIIALAAYFFSISNNQHIYLPLLVFFVIAAQKLIPLIQQMYFSLSNLSSGFPVLNDVLEVILDQSTQDHFYNNNDPIIFNKSIFLKNIYFKYPDSKKYILSNINLKINKGEILGIVGESGSGKSTLIDILMGLLPPTKGNLIIDGDYLKKKNRNSWLEKISHVPQSIYLLDDSIFQNITFNDNKKSNTKKRVLESIYEAELGKFIVNDKYLSKNIGEKGKKISGGEAQRIGIARALFKSSEIIIMDEATSALDKRTEEKILKRIIENREKKTIILISHSKSFLKYCDKVIEIENGRLKKIS